jgi:phosphoribosyl 1,2-cyclic phosphodiesterase
MIDERVKNNSWSDGCNLSVCILASGSRGNAAYVSDGTTSILVDAGLSGREIERRLKVRRLSPKMLDGILVSHEHGDHIQGVGVLSRRFDLPVFITPKTLASAATTLGKLFAVTHFKCGSDFRINTLSIHPFSISHDAKDPSGFTISRRHCKIGFATDLGVATALVKTHLKGCSLLVIEANHDLPMLMEGPYPWHLKQRVKSRTGHLSNDASKDLLDELIHSRLEHVVLAHLSEINNTPQKAAKAVEKALKKNGIRLEVASQNSCGPLLRVK